MLCHENNLLYKKIRHKKLKIIPVQGLEIMVKPVIKEERVTVLFWGTECNFCRKKFKIDLLIDSL